MQKRSLRKTLGPARRKRPGQDPVVLIVLIIAAVVCVGGCIIWGLNSNTPPAMNFFNSVPNVSNADTPVTESPPSLTDLFKSVVLLRCSLPRQRVSEGTGFFFSSDGYLLTNYHVIRDATTIQANYQSSFQEVTVIATDPDQDLALLKLDIKGAPALEFADPSSVRQGEDLIVIGYPLGSALGTLPSITKGTLSSFRDFGGIKRLQIDAAINPGNSGGPLILKSNNKVAGIVVSKVKDASSIGFAIPLEIVKSFVNRSMTNR